MKELFELLSSANGIPALCVLVTLFLLLKIGEFVWKLIEQKDKLKDDTVKELSDALKKNTQTLDEMKPLLSEIPKMKIDLRRYFTAMKIISGDKWKEVYRDVLEEEKMS